MRIPADRPLPEQPRKATSVKRGYDVLVDVDGNPAKRDDPEGVWKRVRNKAYDYDAGVVKFTFVDKSFLFVNNHAALHSRRLENPEAEMRQARESEAAAVAARFGLEFSALPPKQQQAIMLALKDMEKEKG